MKKLYTLLLAVATCFAALLPIAAQTALPYFADGSGRMLASGSRIKITDFQRDPLDREAISPKVFVYNPSASAQQLRLRLTIQKIEKGSVECCFTEQCLSTEQPETLLTPIRTFAAGESAISTLIDFYATNTAESYCTARLELLAADAGPTDEAKAAANGDNPDVTTGQSRVLSTLFLDLGALPSAITTSTFSDAPFAVYDLQGRLRLTQATTLSGLPAGCYVLVQNTRAGRVVRKAFVQ